MDLSYSMWQCCGQCVILTVPFDQSISGLWRCNHKKPKMKGFFSKLVTSAVTFSRCPWNSMTSSVEWVMLLAVLRVPSTLYTGMGFHKGISGTLCVSAHILLIKIVLAPESRSASVWVKFCHCVNGMIWIDRLISHAGLMLCTYVSSGISELFLSFVEELITGLSLLPSPLGDPPDSEFEMRFVAMEFSLSRFLPQWGFHIDSAPSHPKHMCQS